jgi:hypothetical protein
MHQTPRTSPFLLSAERRIFACTPDRFHPGRVASNRPTFLVALECTVRTWKYKTSLCLQESVYTKSEKFLRVHRSFIVQKSKIEIVDRNRIVFNKNYIPVSDSYKDIFQQFLNDNML